MTEMQKRHYHLMLEKNRAMSFFIGKRLGGFCTFYITDDIELYVKANPWDVLEDNKNGHICYVNQLLTDNDSSNVDFFYKGWMSFEKYIKENFKNVETITWRRYYKHNGKIRTYTRRLYAQIPCSIT